MNFKKFALIAIFLFPSHFLFAEETKLSENKCQGAGPQTPRDIDNLIGENKILISPAPPRVC